MLILSDKKKEAESLNDRKLIVKRRHEIIKYTLP